MAGGCCASMAQMGIYGIVGIAAEGPSLVAGGTNLLRLNGSDDIVGIAAE